MTIQQLTFVRPDRFEWHEVPTPTLKGAGEALVRPLAVTRCDLDLYIATGLFGMDGPFAFGHEIAGVVVETGDAVTSLKPGDRVIVPFQISCGTCAACYRGYSNACTSVPRYSAYGLAPSSGHEWGGGLSDLIRVPFAQAMLKPIPASLSMRAAATISDNATDGFRTVSGPLAAHPRAPVLVVGGLAQSVGLFAVQAALALGSQRVVYRDFDAARLALATQLGAASVATDYSRQDNVVEQFPIVVETGGLPAALDYALRSTGPCGVCTSVSAGIGAATSIPLRQMYMKGITYNVSRVHARAEMDAVVEAACCGSLRPDRIITRQVPFEAAAEAMTAADIKLVFVRD